MATLRRIIYPTHYKLSERVNNMSIIQIKYCKIPFYLHAGAFYRNLDSGDPEGIINIPADCFHPDGKGAVDLSELYHLIKTLRYWVLDEPPLGIYRAAASNRVSVSQSKVATAFGDEFAAELAKRLQRIKIRYCDIPNYLHAGAFYRNLDSDDPEGIIEIPADCFHPDGERVEGLSELYHLIKTLRYWVLDEPPLGIYRFVVSKRVHVCQSKVATAFGDEFAAELAKRLQRIKIRYCDIPNYLHAGAFYRNLDSDDPEGFIEIPADCFHPDGERVEGLSELYHLLKVLRYWVLDELPHGVHRAAASNRVSEWQSKVATAFGGEFAAELAKRLQRIKIRYCDIPTYLHAGAFYRNLDSDDPEGIIEIPADCFLPDGETAADLEEFRQLLRVMVFWVLDDMSLGVLNFCNRRNVDVWDKDMIDLPEPVNVEVRPLLLMAYANPKIIPFGTIIATNRWDLISHAVARMNKNGNATAIAADVGNLRVLRYLHQKGFTWHENTCFRASEHGHLDCLRYAHDNGCPWDIRVTSVAAKNGHLECLKYAHTNGCPWNVQVYIEAATNGHQSCMVYAYSQGLAWHADVCKAAAQGGSLECLQFARENGCPWNVDVYVGAAASGSLLCMQYAFVQGLLVWSASVCKAAAHAGHLNCLQFARERGCPWDSDTTVCAAQEGKVLCLQYALQHGCPTVEKACNLACMKGNLACLQVLHQFGVPWSERTSWHAARCPDASCLQYLHENGCRWDKDTPQQAAACGNVAPLRYALAHGCPHFPSIVLAAATSSNLSCLQYLIAVKGLHIGNDVFIAALLRGDLTCLQYLLDQRCPFLHAEFPDDTEVWGKHDKIFRKGSSEFVRCVQLAVGRGWTPNMYFVRYISTRDEPCTAWLKEMNLHAHYSDYVIDMYYV